VTIAHFKARGGVPERRMIVKLGSQLEPITKRSNCKSIDFSSRFLILVKSWKTSYTLHKTPEPLDSDKDSVSCSVAHELWRVSVSMLAKCSLIASGPANLTPNLALSDLLQLLALKAD
jgi:hypothetical protein